MKKIITERVPVRVSIFEESRTQQHFKSQTNINSIMDRYKKTGILPTRNDQPVFGDFSNVEDYQSSLNKLMIAQESFNQLPANIRKRFQNDPGQLIDFISKEENRDEAITLGLVKAKEVEIPRKTGEDQGSK